MAPKLEFGLGPHQPNVFFLPKPYDMPMLEKTLSEAAASRTARVDRPQRLDQLAASPAPRPCASAHRTRTMRAATRRRADGLAQQIRERMRIVVKLIDIRPVLTHELHGQRKGARGIDVVVAEDLVVHGARLQDVRLQSDLKGDGLFVFHGVSRRDAAVRWL